MTTTASSINLTLDGTLGDYGVRPGAMRWMPPQQATAFRDEHTPAAERRRTVQLAAHVRQALAEARP